MRRGQLRQASLRGSDHTSQPVSCGVQRQILMLLNGQLPAPISLHHVEHLDRD